jgi:hypothetical protein
MRCLSLGAEASIIEEPGAEKLHAGVCAGAPGNRRPYRGGVMPHQRWKYILHLGGAHYASEIHMHLAGNFGSILGECSDEIRGLTRYCLASRVLRRLHSSSAQTKAQHKELPQKSRCYL